MKLLTKVIVFISILAALELSLEVNKHLSREETLPEIKSDWWGYGPSRPDNLAINKFEIQVSEQVLDDLVHRLKTAREFTPPLNGVHQQYGFNTNLLKKVIHFWVNRYDWNDRQKFLNQYPQFTTEIQGLKVHFLHVKPNVLGKVRVVPLMILHGWPNSVRDMYDIIPLMTTPRKEYDFVFELIIPSLPGFAFSQGASKPGMGAPQIASILKDLMERLGHSQFYLQGGDWGGIIATAMAALYPNNIQGLHSNFCFSMQPRTILKALLANIYPASAGLTSEEVSREYGWEKLKILIEESGYFHMQASKPDTIGVVLGDSPVGLAAYILEKFSTGTNITYRDLEDGGLLEKFTYTQLLDNVMLYWITNSFTTAMRIYAEDFNPDTYSKIIHRATIKVPTACSKFPNEIFNQTEYFLRDKFKNLIQVTNYEKGGHFAIFEAPGVMADDIFIAIRKMQNIEATS